MQVASSKLATCMRLHRQGRHSQVLLRCSCPLTMHMDASMVRIAWGTESRARGAQAFRAAPPLWPCHSCTRLATRCSKGSAWRRGGTRAEQGPPLLVAGIDLLPRLRSYPCCLATCSTLLAMLV